MARRSAANLALWTAALVLAALPICAQVPAGSQQANDFVFRTLPLATPRAFGGSAVLGDHYYYFGGSQVDPARGGKEAPTSSVIRARVYPDGKLGPWEATTPMPQPRHYIDSSTLVLNDVVYIVGGSSKSLDGTRYNTAIFTRPLPNGALLPWAESQPFGNGKGLSTMSAVSTPGHIHVIGGLTGNSQVLDEVWMNAIYADGSMGSWTAGPPLPAPLWYQSSGVASGRVYVWGGLPASDSKVVSPKVFSAPILGSGKLGDWRTEPVTLPRPFYGATSAVAGNYLLSFSPRYAGSVAGDQAWFAVVTPTGLSQWRPKQTPVPNQRFHTSAPDYRKGLIFFGGGRTTSSGPMLADLWYFQLGASARQSAEQAWLERQRAHLNTVAAFPPPGQGNDGTSGTLAYVSAATLSSSAVAGFKTYNQARTESASQQKPLIVYFHVEGARPCIEQVQQFADPEFSKTLPQACWAWVETNDNPQLAQQLGVYRVPTWVFYDRAGNEVEQARTVGVKSAAELAGTVNAIR